MIFDEFDIDDIFMNMALELAEQGKGQVSPNPMVGCVVVKGEDVIAEGYHEQFGANHAEVNAISQVRGDLRHCTVYITLEPCTHTGKTPPCVDLLISKKPKRVVIAMEDVNPIVRGKGIAKLKASGISVKVGVMEEEARELNRTFIVNQLKNRPYITAKVALTMDGFMAEEDHKSQWISGEKSRTDVHQIRTEVDAILVGRGTVEHDNPRLDVRLVKGKSPRKIVFDTNLSTSLDSYLYDAKRAKASTIVVYSNSEDNNATQFAEKGIELCQVSENADGRIDINEALTKIYEQHNIGHILLEGGSELFSSFYELDLIDEIIVYQTSKIIGRGISPFASINPQSLSDDSRFQFETFKKMDNDVKIVWRRK